jgi:hypothetical protein
VSMEYLAVFAILFAVVAFVTAPLRRAGAATERRATALPDLEAAREAKYRELRDAELDHRTGKLSDADYEELDSSLRAEAIEILHGIDRATIEPQ